MKTLLIGNFGSGNRGDELILLAALEKYGAEKVVVMTANPNFSRTFCECEFETISPLPTGFRSILQWYCNKKYRESWHNLSGNIKQIIFPGGGLFAIKTKAVWIWFTIVLQLRRIFPYISPIFENQGIESINIIANWMIRKSFAQCQYLSTRDDDSAIVLQNWDFAAEKKRDLVQEWLEKTPKKWQKNRGKYVIINAIFPINAILLQKIKKRFLDQKIIFLAMNDIDKNFSDDLPVFVPKTASELLTFVSDAGGMIGERFHALVLGLSLLGKEKTWLLRKPYAKKVQIFAQKEKIKKV